MSITRKITLVLGSTCAATALAAAPALASNVNGLITSNADGSPRYEVTFSGGDANNDVEVGVTTEHFIFRDDHPITTQGQCSPGTPADPADQYMAHCPKIVIDADAHLRIDVGAGDNVAAVGNYPSVIVAAGNGANRLYGGPAADVIHGGDGPDALAGNGGMDELRGLGSDDLLNGGGAGDVLRGGSGRDTVTYDGRSEPLNVTPGSGGANDGETGEHDSVYDDVEIIQGGSAADQMTASPQGTYEFRGNGGNDMLFGNGTPTLLYGGAGEDYLEGGGGADHLNGGNDDDILFGGAGGDDLHGGAGNDLVTYGGSAVPIVADLDGSGDDDGAAGEGDEIFGDVERLYGGSDDDRLTGDGKDNRITGGKGDDVIDGKGGADDLRGGDGEDTLLSADGVADALDCGNGVDKFEPDALDSPIGCETDLRPPPPAGDPGTASPALAQPPAGPVTAPASSPPSTSPAPVVPASRPSLKLTRLRVSRTGVATVTLACVGASGTCDGTLRLRRSGKSAGKRRFALAAGKTTTLRVRLARRSRGRTVQAVAVAPDGTKVTRKARLRK